MTPQQPALEAALDDIALAVDRDFSSIQQRNAHILAALNKHFSPLRLHPHVQIRTVSIH
jgi:hypothetical protein